MIDIEKASLNSKEETTAAAAAAADTMDEADTNKKTSTNNDTSGLISKLNSIDACEYSLDKSCIVIYVMISLVITACLINISLFPQHSELWVCLLSVSLGVIFPQPKLKKKNKQPPEGHEHRRDSLNPVQSSS